MFYCFSGVIETTGEMCQARTSYTQQEVFWGYSFEQLVKFNQETKRWCVDFTHFDQIKSFPTPPLSAKDMSAVFKGKEERTLHRYINICIYPTRPPWAGCYTRSNLRCIYPTPPQRAKCGTRSILKQSWTSLNSEFSFS